MNEDGEIEYLIETDSCESCTEIFPEEDMILLDDGYYCDMCRESKGWRSE